MFKWQGRGSSVGIATRNALAVLGSNRGGGEIFLSRPERPWGTPSLLYNGYRVFTGVKAAGAWRWPLTPHPALRLKSRAIHLLPLWAFVACSRVKFTFTLLFKWILRLMSGSGMSYFLFWALGISLPYSLPCSRAGGTWYKTVGLNSVGECAAFISIVLYHFIKYSACQASTDGL